MCESKPGRDCPLFGGRLPKTEKIGIRIDAKIKKELVEFAKQRGQTITAYLIGLHDKEMGRMLHMLEREELAHARSV